MFSWQRKVSFGQRTQHIVWDREAVWLLSYYLQYGYSTVVHRSVADTLINFGQPVFELENIFTALNIIHLSQYIYKKYFSFK